MRPNPVPPHDIDDAKKLSERDRDGMSATAALGAAVVSRPFH
jgi:hypothetical protein